MRTYRQGAVAPDSYAIVAVPGNSGLDMSTDVTAATIVVQDPKGTEVSYAGVLSGATATAVTITYDFPTDPSPFLIPGVYRAHAHLTVTGGYMDTEETEILVKAPHEL